MERQRDGQGRYKRSDPSTKGKTGNEVGEKEPKAEVLTGAPRPRNCRVFMRARFAEAMPEVAATLVREAKKGSVAHLKLLVQISGMDKGEVAPARYKKREKNLEEILMEAWEQEVAEEHSGGVAEVFPDTSGGE